jgi:hypothetical protein
VRIEKLVVESGDEPFSYRDVIVLQTGLIFRGTIVEEAPGERIVLLTDDGLSLAFPMTDVWRIVVEKCVAGQSRAAIGEHPASEDVRRRFSIEVTVRRVEQAEAATGEGAASGRLERLREQLAELEREEEENNEKRAEGEESIARLRDRVAAVEEEADGLGTELARRALACAEEHPEAREAALDAYGVLQGELDGLTSTALLRMEVDPRLLTEQIELEHQLRRVELTSLLRPPLPMGGLDPAVKTLVSTFDKDERRQFYQELQTPARPRYTLFNALVPFGVGSFLQGDYLSGTIIAGAIGTGTVLLLNDAIRVGQGSEPATIGDYSLPFAVLGAGYIYSLAAPTVFRIRQNRRLESALRVDEELEADQ